MNQQTKAEHRVMADKLAAELGAYLSQYPADVVLAACVAESACAAAASKMPLDQFLLLSRMAYLAGMARLQKTAKAAP